MARTEVVSELRRIQALNGGLLRPSDIVAEASAPDSPLHHCFNWDDTAAAHQWRLQQARQLIRVVVEVLPYEEPHYEVRAYVSLMPDRVQQNGGYRVLTEVLASPPQRQQMLAEALQELNRFKVRYHQLSELDAVFRAAERAQRNHGQPPPPPPAEPDGDGAVT
jgi:hypothetical protein